jgi:flagellar biosynthesis/type III secretory pathway protein FliH
MFLYEEVIKLDEKELCSFQKGYQLGFEEGFKEG